MFYLSRELSRQIDISSKRISDNNLKVQSSVRVGGREFEYPPFELQQWRIRMN